MNNNQGNPQRRPSAPAGQRPQGQRPMPQQSRPVNRGTAPQQRPAPQNRPTQQQPSRRPPVQSSYRGGSRRRGLSNEALALILVILAVILVALIVTFIIIKNADNLDSDPVESTSDPSVEAGLNDPDEERPEWQPNIENASAFKPKTDSSTVTLAADEIDSKHAIMVDAATGKVVCEYGADARIYPASMTKLMTVIVACELIDDMNETFTFSKELLYTIEAGSSNAYFKAGNPVPMVDLIYGAILPSGADACLGLANALAGSEEAFVDLMNKKAKELGCTGTNFTNAIGLHNDNHYSTARDIATIMAYATENPFLKKVITATSYKTVAPVDRVDGTLYSSWQVGSSTKAKIFGAKSGYTPEAGCCLASISKTNDGREYIIVTAEADAKAKTFSDASRLCDKYIK